VRCRPVDRPGLHALRQVPSHTRRLPGVPRIFPVDMPARFQSEQQSHLERISRRHLAIRSYKADAAVWDALLISHGTRSDDEKQKAAPQSSTEHRSLLKPRHGRAGWPSANNCSKYINFHRCSPGHGGCERCLSKAGIRAEFPGTGSKADLQDQAQPRFHGHGDYVHVMNGALGAAVRAIARVGALDFTPMTPVVYDARLLATSIARSSNNSAAVACF